MTKSLSDWLDEVHAGALIVSFDAVMADDQAIVAETVVDYLHTLLARLDADDVRRDILDRMAAQVAVEGFKADHGHYYGLLP
jgi:hypothetical protein